MNLHDKLKRLAEILPGASPGESWVPLARAEFITLASPLTVRELLKLVEIVTILVERRGRLVRGCDDQAAAQYRCAWEEAERWLREAQPEVPKPEPRHPMVEGLRGSLTNVLYDNTSSLQEREAEVESVLDLISHKLGSALPEVAPR